PELSKSSVGYVTFLSREGCDYVKEYLEERARSGESLDPDTDVIHPQLVEKRFIRTLNIGDGVRKAIRDSGFLWRPYVLRHFFDTQLLLAESKGKVAHDYRVHWMGHVGSIDARYTTNKGKLPQTLIDDMRAAYARCEVFLTTLPTSGTAEQAVKSTQKAVLMALGFTEVDADRALEGEIDAAAIAEMAKSLRGAAPSRAEFRGDEARAKILAGWSIVTRFDDGTYILEVPAIGSVAFGVAAAGPDGHRAIVRAE
ncbi:MAG: hypothetical protein ACREEC_14745, partial [Thermoplasmata archaeon]